MPIVILLIRRRGGEAEEAEETTERVESELHLCKTSAKCTGDWQINKIHSLAIREDSYRHKRRGDNERDTVACWRGQLTVRAREE